MVHELLFLHPMMVVVVGILIFPINIFVIRTSFSFIRRHFRHRNRSSLEVEIFMNHLILTMKAGMAFEAALKDILSRDIRWQNFLDSLEKPQSRDKSKVEQIVTPVLLYCRANPTQSFKVLSQARQMVRLQRKFELKYQTASLQGKAQAVVSILIYLVILLVHGFMNPEFNVFFTAPIGKFLFCLSVGLLVLGVRMVFSLSRLKDINL